MTASDSLISRLEAAEVGDRQSDSLIDRALNNRPPWAAKDTTPLTCWEDGRVTMGPNGAGWDAPRYTTSLDAALALAERLFPNAEIYVGRHEGQWDADCEPAGCDRSGRFVDHKGATPALALCIAVLRAKEASQ